jgi:hypothetical protein
MHGTFQYVQLITFQIMKSMFHIHKNSIVTNKHLVCLHGKKNTKIKCFDFQIQRKQGVYCNLSKWSTLHML